MAKETKEKESKNVAFEIAIKEHLDEYAALDPLFVNKLNNPKKSIRECADYIINYVKDKGMQGLPSDDVYSLARHYYDEDEIAAPESAECTIVLNKLIAPTEEEIADLKRKAREEVFESEKEKMTKPKKTPAVASVDVKKDKPQSELF